MLSTSKVFGTDLKISCMAYDYLVVGAGLTGALYAHVLKKHGYRVLVMEKGKKIGGLCSTSLQHGIMVHDYGAHIFRTDDDEVWNFVNSVCEFKPFINTPIAIYKGKAYNLPFNMNTFAQLYGVTTPKEAYKALQADIRTTPNQIHTLEDYILSKVGYKVYKTLIEGYTYKQWGVSAKELSPRVMSHIPIRLTYNNNYYNDKYQGVPKIGYTAFIARLLEGCDVALQCKYNLHYDEFVNSPMITRGVVYTGPLDELFDYRYGKLDFRSVSFEHKYFENENDLQGVAVFNYTDMDVPYTRSIEHKHFLHQQCNGTVISYEYPMPASSNGMPIYPVYDDRNLRLQRKYQSLAKKMPALICAGQLADYRSYNMSQIVKKVLSWERKLK